LLAWRGDAPGGLFLGLNPEQAPDRLATRSNFAMFFEAACA
jgi:hypothetical protein